MFITGQKIVCINDTFAPGIAALYTMLPKKDTVYVVRGATVGVHHDGKGNREEGVFTVYVVGLTNPCAPSGRERGFLSDRFRALEELSESEIRALTNTNSDGNDEPEKVLVGREWDEGRDTSDDWKKAA